MTTYQTMKTLLTIGQTWTRKKDKVQMTVKQIHRPDKSVQMQAEDGTRITVKFSELRSKWTQDES